MQGIRKTVAGIFITALILSVLVLIYPFLQGYVAQKDTESLERYLGTQDGQMIDNGYISDTYAALWRKNKDLIGWIKIDGTNINYPVMQTPNDLEKYINKNFRKKHEYSGTPFMGADCSVMKENQNWLIYGQNMLSGIMFHDLLKYAEKGFYRRHGEIRFDTIYLGQQAKYKVISAFFTRIDAPGFRYCEYVDLKSKNRYQEYIQNVKRRSIYETELSAKYGEQLITLSTYSDYYGSHDKGRFVVVAKRIKEV